MAVRRGQVQAPRPKKKWVDEEEEHPAGMERWLVTYADMLTLLFVLFVILFSMSNLDSTKYQQLKNGLAAGFGVSQSLLSGERAILNGNNADASGVSAASSAIGSNSSPPILQQTPQVEQQIQQQVAQQVQQQMAQMTQRTAADAKAHVQNLLNLWKKIHTDLQKKGLADDVVASIDDRGLVISLVSRHIVFPYNLWNLTPRGERIVDTIAPALKDITEQIEIDGHTNQQGAKPKYFATDWDLAYARASTVLSRLHNLDGIANGRLRATSFGHVKPLIDPSKPDSQYINKRVDIVVLSDAAAGEREDFPSEAAVITQETNNSADLFDTSSTGSTGGN